MYVLNDNHPIRSNPQLAAQHVICISQVIKEMLIL